MKKLVFLFSLFCATSASAYTPTYGCFVENYGVSCSTGTITCVFSGDFISANNLAFGTTVGGVCNTYTMCLSSLNARDSQYNSCVSQYNSLVPLYNKNLAALKKQKTLITKLRAACGTRCKRIK